MNSWFHSPFCKQHQNFLKFSVQNTAIILDFFSYAIFNLSANPIACAFKIHLIFNASKLVCFYHHYHRPGYCHFLSINLFYPYHGWGYLLKLSSFISPAFKLPGLSRTHRIKIRSPHSSFKDWVSESLVLLLLHLLPDLCSLNCGHTCSNYSIILLEHSMFRAFVFAVLSPSLYLWKSLPLYIWITHSLTLSFC